MMTINNISHATLYLCSDITDQSERLGPFKADRNHVSHSYIELHAQKALLSLPLWTAFCIVLLAPI